MHMTCAGGHPHGMASSTSCSDFSRKALFSDFSRKALSDFSRKACSDFSRKALSSLERKGGVGGGEHAKLVTDVRTPDT